MANYFKETPTLSHRAYQIWLILISNATFRRTITYGILAKMLGYNGADVLSRQLGHIMYYCQQNDLPPLTVIVVNQKTGIPGVEYVSPNDDVNIDREKVFSYKWFYIIPPTPRELQEAYEKN